MIEIHAILRGLIIMADVAVMLLYFATGYRLLTCYKSDGFRVGRLALGGAVFCLLSLSIGEEIVAWGDPLAFREAAQLTASTLLVVAWWKLVGIRFAQWETMTGARSRANSRPNPRVEATR